MWLHDHFHKKYQTWNLSKIFHCRIFRLKIVHRQFHLILTVLVRKNTTNEWKWRNLHHWQKFYTAAGTDGMDKFHFCPISGVRIVKMTKSKNMLTGGGTRTCYLYILPYIQGQDSAKAKKSKRKKGSQEEELGQAASREPRSPQRSSPSRSWHTWSPIMMFYVLSPGHTKRH